MQAAARGVTKSFGQYDLVAGVFGKRPFKGDAVDGAVITAFFVDFGFKAVFGTFEHNALRHFDGDRRIKAQAHGANGQAGCISVFALTGKAGHKRLAHFKVKTLFHAVGHAAGGGDAFAKHYAHIARCIQAAVAGQRDKAVRLGLGLFFIIYCFEQISAGAAVNHANSYFLAYAFYGAPNVIGQCGGCGCAVEFQYKKLFFVDACACAG